MRASGATTNSAMLSAGRINCLKARPPALEIAGEQEVDQQEAGPPWRQRREDIDPAGRVGRKPEQVVEDIDQQQARDEGRHADAERAEEPHAVVDGRARPQRRQHAERHRRHQRDQQRREGQLQRGRQPFAQILRDQLPGHHRSAEIAAADIIEIEHQLFRHRLVEAHLLADDLDLLLAGVRPGGEEHRRIARQHPHQQEGEDEHAKERRQRGQEAPARPCHRCSKRRHQTSTGYLRLRSR